MQEAALSQSCQVVCGGTSLEWSAFYTFKTIATKLHLNPFSGMEEPNPAGWLRWKKILTTLILLERPRVTKREDYKLPVCALFLLGESKDCKEAVDRIWAISALFPNSLQQRIREAGIIDYSASSKKQYWKAYLRFLKLLYLESPVDLWLIISYGQGLAKNLNLPSWCPDFNATRQYNYHFYSGKDCRAGYPDPKGFIIPTLLLTPESAFLTVKGFTFDTIQSVAQNISPASTPTRVFFKDELEAFQDWLQEIFQLLHEALGRSQEAVAKLCQTFKAVMRTPVITEAWQQDHKRLVQLVSFMYEAWHLGVGDHLEDEIWESLKWRVDGWMFQGRPFITSTQRRIGFGTADMRSGDMVCIVEGADAVFVLRRVDHKTVLSSGIHSQGDLDQHQELFSLVGDAYIHGCMYGEAFTASDRGPDREFALA